ncbi:MAG: 2-hydroxyacyl-CoA dehydratase family protein [Gemmatimonadota bacterium]|nr:2-hydroxyacyl-CoA dehydratase family protein [Gemmatimonadota bacterium]MDH5760532.1 2-hydroxyacyl-CoA dehydratase family protein [Gemmatimonadota bacterium]
MTSTISPEDLVGRGARDGAALFRDWFTELGTAAERGEHTAYVFVMGSLAEIVRTFDVHTVFPEITSLQTAVRRVADEYLNLAEDHGFSPDVCGYVKADYALQIRKGDHPMGRIPPPSIAVLTNACNTYLKWAEIWERLYDIPIVTVDVPQSRKAPDNGGPTAAELAPDQAYVQFQMNELIGHLEELTGKAFDIDRLREVLELTNRMGRAWRRVLELNRAKPAVFDAMMEGTIYLGVANALRGTEAGARYFEDLAEEMEYKAAHGIGPLVDHDTEHRLIFVGVPCYPIFRRFYQLFTDWGGVFVSSTYTWFASGGLNLDFEYDLDRPLESLAEGVLLSVRRAVDSMLFHDRYLKEAIDAFDADGVVYHPVKSCRTVSTGLADSRRVVLDERDVLCLYIESDMMDKRVVSEAQLKNRIDAFFEGLESRRIRKGMDAPTASTAPTT